MQGSGNYFLLTEGESQAQPNVEDHDYEEPYFEPASKEEELLQQLKAMSVPFIDEGRELELVMYLRKSLVL